MFVLSIGTEITQSIAVDTKSSMIIMNLYLRTSKIHIQGVCLCMCVCVCVFMCVCAYACNSTTKSTSRIQCGSHEVHGNLMIRKLFCVRTDGSTVFVLWMFNIATSQISVTVTSKLPWNAITYTILT